ncbi:MAG: FAD:protein FMN transferase [Deltaproteobacteria bacterium]|nr:FAD:protein FMN transferase [Deltaproteobacteria bacterium]
MRPVRSLQCLVVLTSLLSGAVWSPAASTTETFSPEDLREFSQQAKLPTGQVVHATVLGLQKHAAAIQNVFDVALRDLSAVAAQFDAGNPKSDLARINAGAGKSPVTVAPTTMELLKMAQKARRMTDGAFDITSGGTALDITINKHQRTVAFLKPEMEINVAPVLDGFFADRLMAMLWKANIDNAMVEVGKASRSVGSNIVGSWQKTVTDVAGRYAGQGMTITFSNAATSTVARKGTGPAKGVQSATVITDDAALADALASALSTMELEDGLRMANRLPHVHALVRDRGGRLHKSKGF